MFRSALLLSTVSVLAMTSVCRADDDHHYNWTGLYFGAHVGAGQFKADADISDLTNYEGYGGQTVSRSYLGFIGGGQLGFNLQSRRFVFGAEVDFSGLSGLGSRYPIQYIDSGETADITGEASALATVRARVGYDIAHGTMIYTTAGVGWLKTKNNVWVNEISGGRAKGGNFSASKWTPAFVVGTGVEHMLTEHVSVRGEALWVLPESIVAPALDPHYFSDGNAVTYNNSLVTGRLGINVSLRWAPPCPTELDCRV